jgi:hypothetical protein
MGAIAMSRELSNGFLQELFKQESGDPFLALFTLSHPTFSDIRLVNNTEDITSNGLVYQAFPVNLQLPVDDGETVREVLLTLDNVSLDLIDELRSVTDYINVNIQMVLASNPDLVEIELGELKLKTIEYNALSITGRLYMDDFFKHRDP